MKVVQGITLNIKACGLNGLDTHYPATTSGCFYHIVKYRLMHGVYTVRETILLGVPAVKWEIKTSLKMK